MIVLVDSGILIEVARGRDLSIVSRWTELSRSDAVVLVSAISVAELWAGARRPEHEILERLFGSLVCVAVDLGVGRQAGEYLRRYRKSHSVELGDAIIAASTVASDAALWTRNRKHYPMKQVRFFE